MAFSSFLTFLLLTLIHFSQPLSLLLHLTVGLADSILLCFQLLSFIFLTRCFLFRWRRVPLVTSIIAHQILIFVPFTCLLFPPHSLLTHSPFIVFLLARCIYFNFHILSSWPYSQFRIPLLYNFHFVSCPQYLPWLTSVTFEYLSFPFFWSYFPFILPYLIFFCFHYFSLPP